MFLVAQFVEYVIKLFLIVNASQTSQSLKNMFLLFLVFELYVEVINF